jgi:hypothetical protein
MSNSRHFGWTRAALRRTLEAGGNLSVTAPLRRRGGNVAKPHGLDCPRLDPRPHIAEIRGWTRGHIAEICGWTRGHILQKSAAGPAATLRSVGLAD